MKKVILAGLAGVLLVGAGCVKTVSNQTSAAVPFLNDKTEGRYERSVLRVYEAARTVVGQMATITEETTQFQATNVVKIIVAKTDKRKIWVRVESVDPTVTSVKVQARTSGGGTDTQLIHEIDKRIALELTTR